MINPEDFEYESSRYKDLYNYLLNKGFEVYPPSTHNCECLSKYVVVKYDGPVQISGYSSHYDLYSVMCFVPIDKYAELEEFVTEVTKAIEEIRPLFRKYDAQQSYTSLDESARAYYVSIEYCNIKKD